MDIKQRSDHTKIRFGNKLILQQRTNINTAVSSKINDFSFS